MWNINVESFLGQDDMSRLSFVLSNKAWDDVFLGLGSWVLDCTAVTGVSLWKHFWLAFSIILTKMVELIG